MPRSSKWGGAVGNVYGIRATALGLPNYSNYQMSASFPFTAPNDGLACVNWERTDSNGSFVICSVNDKVILAKTNNFGGGYVDFVPMRKGDVLSVSKSDNANLNFVGFYSV